MIDEVIFGTAKIDDISSGMKNDEDMCVEIQFSIQQEEITQQIQDDEPIFLALNLFGVKGQHVKKKKLASDDMTIILDRVCESTR